LFIEAFAFQPHSVANFVGGGGKTALIHQLMAEYCTQGPVLHTTTTRIHPPSACEEFVVISSDNLELLKTMVHQIARDCPDRAYKLVATRSYLSPTLLRGVPRDFAAALDRKLFPVLLNEADGAAGFSIKLPRENEPVLMEGARYLVPVIGIDCISKPMGPDQVFRWQTCAERFSLQAGEPLTVERAADILMHKQGVCRHWMPETEIIPYINKVEDTEQESAARLLASRILNNGNFPVERVVIGSARLGRADLIPAPKH
jgi:probable selenium-dependent hydroxylase accessory protein YqeC